jgi:hypothetical protein
MSPLTIEIVEGAEEGRQFELRGPLEIGRDPRAGIVLSDRQVSRHHARIEPGGGVAAIEDLGSHNGTYVNGQIAPGRRTVSPGDQIRLGLTVLQLRTEREVAAQPSAIGPRPRVTVVADDVLRPAKPDELAPVPPAADVTPAPGPLRVEESEPAFVPAEAAEHSGRRRSDALAALIDGRVKRQTNVAAFALLAAAALAVAIYFGAR